jgi:hypothetical protein
VGRVKATARLSLVLALVVATVSGAQAPGPRKGPPPEVERRVIDIPLARYVPGGGRVTRPLRRAVDLLQMLWDGRGSSTDGGIGRRGEQGIVSLASLPWRAPEAARLVSRTLGGVADEATLALVLWERDAWCTAPLGLEPESRLRLEATAIGVDGPARLRVRWIPEAGPRWDTTADASPPAERALPSTDLPLPSGRGTLCFEAEGGPVSVGEPRILAPEVAGSDPRPRWIVLTICDSMRGDALEGIEAGRVAPAMVALARGGQRYTEDVSAGAHTMAGLWPLLTGRDLARVDPLKAGRFTPQGTPMPLLYSRANLAVSHLAQAAGYHTVFLGNNSHLRTAPLFARLSNHGKADTGTVDTIAALPAVMGRYADERVFLVYYVSAPHSYSFTPRRLFDALGCPTLAGGEAARCAYAARIAHADEAVRALQEGLADHGLRETTLQVLTADHGELLGDARRIEVQLYDRWWSLNEGHGASTHWNELHVPLVLSGPGLRPGTWKGRVSSLDVVPTLAAAGSFPLPHRLDGRVLPLSGGSRTPASLLVSQGYCTHSVLEGPRQLIWWEAECARRRELGTGRPITQRAELWQDGTLAATDETAPLRVAPLVRRHLEWLAARLPNEVWVLDAARLTRTEVRLSVPGGRVTDWGPSGSPGHLACATAALGPDERELRIVFGDDPGLFYVATWPPDAAVRIDVDRGSEPPPVTFVGRLQLPLNLLGRLVDPRERPDLWVAEAEPEAPPSARAALRVWRQPYRGSKAAPRGLDHLDRAPRE